MNIDIFVEQWMGPESLDYYYIDWVVKEVKRLRKRNEWLEEVVGLAQEHWGIDLSDHREWPQWREEE